jgi:hypothetical protein
MTKEERQDLAQTMERHNEFYRSEIPNYQKSLEEIPRNDLYYFNYKADLIRILGEFNDKITMIENRIKILNDDDIDLSQIMDITAIDKMSQF